MRTEIRFSGFGGQGVVLMGYIMGNALALHEALECVMTQAYGPEARGGASSSNIVVSKEPIDYPFVQEPDILVALSQEAYTKFRPTAKDGATIIIDNGLVDPSAEDNTHGIPATQFAEYLGRRIVTNVVMMGFVTAVTGIANRESVEKAIEATVKTKTIPLNLKAFAAGFDYALEKELAK
ncbi:MAG: hypothetical protein FVQ83_04930 [Chloroflexi bacterium]|nr:hypothetical protein [Chloroflexota bacterium]